MPRQVVVASGYFDPIHCGHIEYLEQAKALGKKLIVIVNNDLQTALKKGKAFMSASERLKIVRALHCVDMAILSVDSDRTVCRTLAAVLPDVFANGGDQFNQSIPEAATCAEYGIELIDGLGSKIQSSSWLLRAAAVKDRTEEQKNVTVDHAK